MLSTYAITWQASRMAGNKINSSHVRWWRFATVIALMIIGGYWRLFDLGLSGFWMDEAFSVQTARAIQIRGMPEFDNGETSWLWLPAHYIMAASISLPGDVHVTSRLPSAVSGVLMIPVVYFLAFSASRSHAAALLASVMVTFSFPDIAWSRQARGYMLLLLTGYTGIASVIWSIEKRRYTGLLLGACMLSLSILTHRAGYVFWLISTCMVACSWLARPRNKSRLDAVTVIALLVVLCSSFFLPAGSSQGLDSSLRGVSESPGHISYADKYFNYVLDTVGWNIFWGVAGLVGVIIRKWWVGIPFMIGCASYFYILSERTFMFHERYLLPLMPLIHVCVATGPLVVIRYLDQFAPTRSIPRRGIFAVISILFLATSASQKFSFKPLNHYDLGYTAPQVEWRDAIAWLSAKEENPSTIMCLPVFHDIYLGSNRGTKYFLPFTFTGAPGHWQEKPSYTSATVLSSLRQYRLVNGYIILDEFSFQAMKDHALRQRIDMVYPVFVSHERSVQIWRTADLFPGMNHVP